jgi:propionyl-CoA carboxylase alpha chain
MNTRLQVEHPVTEMVTGLDLVELMIRIAAGERLPITQQEVSSSGWALEARISAEDPLRGFLPSIGRLVRYTAPAEGRFVRVDSGVREGSEISMFYDPMIAKLIAWNINRDHAIAGLAAALDEFYIRGVAHNIGFLSALLKHPRFIKGDLSTGFIAEEYPEGCALVDPEPNEALVFAAVAAIVHRLSMTRSAAIDGQLPGHEFRVNDDWVVMIGGQYYPVIVAPAGGGDVVIYGDEHLQVNHDWRLGDPLFRATMAGQELCMQIEPDGIGYQLRHGGLQVKALVLSSQAAEYYSLMPLKPPPDLSKFLISPMPGLLLQLLVAEGDAVDTGQPLAVIEAMKMENVLRAEQAGTVAKLLAAEGDSLAVDQPLIEFA